jgi:hypothetical protein
MQVSLSPQSLDSQPAAIAAGCFRCPAPAEACLRPGLGGGNRQEGRQARRL